MWLFQGASCDRRLLRRYQPNKFIGSFQSRWADVQARLLAQGRGLDWHFLGRLAHSSEGTRPFRRNGNPNCTRLDPAHPWLTAYTLFQHIPNTEEDI